MLTSIQIIYHQKRTTNTIIADSKKKNIITIKLETSLRLYLVCYLQLTKIFKNNQFFISGNYYYSLIFLLKNKNYNY